MKKMNRVLALVLAAAMTCSLAAVSAGAEDTKWSEKKTGDGWIRVTNEGGETLGYSPKSGVSLIEVDGYAFKDLDRDGELDVYEDWRESDEDRAADLASKLEIEEMTALFTHGGWSSFGSTIEGDDLTYVENGGRAGVTRSATVEGNTTMAVDWTNALQALCEATGSWGIPATISVDPSHISNTIDQNSLASTFSADEAFAQGVSQAKMYRSVGVTMLLGPQLGIGTEPLMTRSTGTYTEDPALARDLSDAFISGLQSTWAEDGTDLGWGVDSVYGIAKHFVGDGATEGGRNDHMDAGKFDVFPGDNFEAHLISFFDGAFNLTRSITQTCGVMPNYAISYSRDGSLGELVGGAYSSYKMGLLYENDYQGFILTDWQITNDGQQCYGVEDYTVAERFALLYASGVHQVGGISDTEAAQEGYEIFAEDIAESEEEAEAVLRNAAYHFLLTQFQCGLYENPYIDLDTALETVWNNSTDAAAKLDQQKTVIMLKNSDGTISQSNGEKKTVYLPMMFTPAQEAGSSQEASPAKWDTAVPVKDVEKIFNVVTDTIGEPTGEDGTYTENDVIRASAEEIASCDMILMFMDAPSQDSTQDDDGNWLPASLQYGEYTAVNARRESIAADVETEIVNDGYYGTKTQTVKLNRSYAGNTVGADDNYSQLELLEYVNTVKGDAKVVVLMSKSSGPSVMVFSEVEPLADAILYYYGDSSWVFTDALLEIVNGDVEPTALLPFQMPASMDAVEAEKEDVPRDMECYVDSDGNVYDFAYGLNWSGKIEDERVTTYSVEPLTEVESIDFHYAED